MFSKMVQRIPYQKSRVWQFGAAWFYFSEHTNHVQYEVFSVVTDMSFSCLSSLEDAHVSLVATQAVGRRRVVSAVS